MKVGREEEERGGATDGEKTDNHRHKEPYNRHEEHR